MEPSAPPSGPAEAESGAPPTSRFWPANDGSAPAPPADNDEEGERLSNAVEKFSALTRAFKLDYTAYMEEEAALNARIVEFDAQVKSPPKDAVRTDKLYGITKREIQAQSEALSSRKDNLNARSTELHAQLPQLTSRVVSYALMSARSEAT
jgi:hypothetical protein